MVPPLVACPIQEKLLALSVDITKQTAPMHGPHKGTERPPAPTGEPVAETLKHQLKDLKVSSPSGTPDLPRVALPQRNAVLVFHGALSTKVSPGALRKEEELQILYVCLGESILETSSW